MAVASLFSRRRLLVGAGLVVLAVAGAAVVMAQPFSGGPSTAANQTETSLATVEQRSLSSRTQIDGTLGYAGNYSVVNLAVPKSAPLDSAVLAAQQGAVSAQAQLNDAIRALTDLSDGPTQSEVLAAQQEVTSAQAQLDEANRALSDLANGPAQSELLAAQQEITSAEAQLEQAKAARSQLDSTVSDAVTAAQQAMKKAQDALDSAERGADAASTSLSTAKATLLAEESAYCAIPPDSRPSFCPGARTAPISASDERALLAIKASGTPEAEATHAAAVLAANDAYRNALAAEETAEAAVTSAQGDVTAAQSDLSKANAGLNSSEVASADAAVAAAQQGLDTAKAKLAELVAGPTASEQAAAQANVSTAKAGLDTANAKLAELYEGPTASELGTAQDSVGIAEASLSAANAQLTEAYEGTDQASGNVTELPSAGDVVEEGDVLYSVSGAPVVLLYGTTPAYRDLAVDAKGPDVQQLNASLVALGYATAEELDPNSDEFTPATEAAVKKLQAALGAEQTGTLRLGQVAFLPSAVRVTSVLTSLGSLIQPGTAVLDATSTSPVVTVELDPARQSQIKQGESVEITLPDLTKVAGTVSSVGTVATAADDTGQGGGPTIAVEITLADPAAAGGLDQAPVIVAITTATVDDALVVPITALLALAGGGYAVDVVASDGVHTLVPVTTGIFDGAAGLVQVTGTGLSAGQQVVVPGR